MQKLQERLAKGDNEREAGGTLPQPQNQTNPANLQAGPSNQSQQAVPIQPTLTNQQAISQFRKYNPPIFDGEFNTERAEAWVRQMEKIFGVMECTPEQKALLATFQLEKEADYWWRSTEMIVRARNTPVTWETFLNEFYDKYFPSSVRDEKETEFILLKQTDEMIVDQYVAKFIELSRYSSYLQRQDDERWRSEKFERGLKPAIRDRVTPQRIREFNTLVEVCRVTENNLRRMQGVRIEVPRTKRRQDEIVIKDINKKKGKAMWFKKGQKRGRMAQSGREFP